MKIRRKYEKYYILSIKFRAARRWSIWSSVSLSSTRPFGLYERLSARMTAVIRSVPQRTLHHVSRLVRERSQELLEPADGRRQTGEKRLREQSHGSSGSAMGRWRQRKSCWFTGDGVRHRLQVSGKNIIKYKYNLIIFEKLFKKNIYLFYTFFITF